MTVAVYLDKEGKQHYSNNVSEYTDSLFVEKLESRRSPSQKSPREGGVYKLKRMNSTNGSFKYANASTKAFFPFDYFLHKINKSPDMNIVIRVLTGIDSKYAEMSFKLKNAQSIHFWNKVESGFVKVQRNEGKMYLLILDENWRETGYAVELEAI
ncbi:MAG: hypothetical protein CL760_09205 [Chloroflexi bacterium]|nr:hypothetical protein [Chloroflexota bacterium]|tara:strand:+ start:23219 stop:23683 length:465 start_codon:yes stop_codon:yes gene_type:complete